MILAKIHLETCPKIGWSFNTCSDFHGKEILRDSSHKGMELFTLPPAQWAFSSGYEYEASPCAQPFKLSCIQGQLAGPPLDQPDGNVHTRC